MGTISRFEPRSRRFGSSKSAKTPTARERSIRNRAMFRTCFDSETSSRKRASRC